MPTMTAGADSTAYSISTDEMDRRSRAYTTFIVSLLIVISASSIDYLFSAPTIVLPCLLGLALVLVLSKLAFLKSFRGYSQIRVLVDDSHIERIRGTSSEKYLVKDIVGFRAKRTSRGSIREITVRLGDGRRFIVNALRDFERFEQELQKKAPASAVKSEVKEPIDYDHPLFYVVFGVMMGLAVTTAIRVIAVLSEKGLKWTNLGIACYAFVVGAYLLLGRPLSQRYGTRSRSVDLVLGSLALLSGIVLAARSLIGLG